MNWISVDKELPKISKWHTVWVKDPHGNLRKFDYYVYYSIESKQFDTSMIVTHWMKIQPPEDV